MKIIHTSDLHFGISLAGQSLIENQREFVAWFLKLLKNEKPAAVLVSGDVFDKAVVNAEAMALYDEFVTGVCAHCKLFVIAGNHDGAERLAVCAQLLKRSGLYIQGRLGEGISTHVLECDGERVHVHMLPFCNADEIKILLAQNELPTFSDAVSAVLKSHSRVEGEKNILMAHLFAAGGEVAGSDMAARVGGSDQVSLNVFEGYDYVALGHIHKPQTMRGRIRYSGAPLKYEFSEGKKSVTLYDTASGNIDVREVEVSTDVREIIGEEAELYEKSLQDKCKNDFLRIVFTDAHSSLHLFEKFKGIYKNLLTITGKRYESGANTITAAEVSELSPADILKRFVLEQTGKEASAYQIELFLKAYEKECV